MPQQKREGLPPPNIIASQYCPGDGCGSPPNAVGGKGLDVIAGFFDLKSDRSKRACLGEKAGV